MALAIVLIIGILGGIVKGLSFLPWLLPSLSGAEESSVIAGEAAQIYTPAGTVAGLKIELKAAALEIRTGDAFRAESNLSHLAVTEENGVWAFRETRSFISSDAEAHHLILYIPAQAALEEVTLDTGAGKVRIDTLTADRLELELGAGSFRASTLNATRQADIDGGARQIAVNSVIVAVVYNHYRLESGNHIHARHFAAIYGLRRGPGRHLGIDARIVVHHIGQVGQRMLTETADDSELPGDGSRQFAAHGCESGARLSR